ncbi:MAG TPA: VWA domain-containing protein [bacterium]|nr:VWA domain-containing protein [bacterium]
MNDQYKEILAELYQLDSSLREHEETLKKLLTEILEHRPEIKVDENFAKDLHQKLMTKFENKSQPVLIKKTWFAWSAIGSVSVAALAILFFWAQGSNLSWPSFLNGPERELAFGEVIDDWQFDMAFADEDSSLMMMKSAAPTMNMAREGLGGAAQESLGLAVGGSKDINSFRENIKNNYLPLASAITAEGLFYDYYFDTGKTQACEKTFCPSYNYAISKDPISGKEDYYLAVGLNSNLKAEDFERKKLNLVVVLDVSGSMGSSFDQYYYDGFGNQKLNSAWSEEDAGKSKMQVASESLVAMLDHLNPDDRLGIVLFDDQSYLAKPLNYVGQTDMAALRQHILDLQEMGGTNMEAGLQEGSALFDDLGEVNLNEYENRVIFLTDAMPNTGSIDENDLLWQFTENAKNNIFTTFIGIGVDFNSDLVEAITKVKGANYYSVQSSSQFKTRLDEEFEFMVTPLIFDLKLNLQSENFQIEKVYGSPEADLATGELMSVKTLFPSKTEGGESKGGIVLLKLKTTNPQGVIKLSTTYQTRDGQTDGQVLDVVIGARSGEYYDNKGIRKAILLARYVDLMQNWILDERSILELPQPMPLPVYRVNYEDGIKCPPFIEFSPWEQSSVPLSVNAHYQEMMTKFKTYFQSEFSALDDDTLKQDLEILNRLLSAVNNYPDPLAPVDDWSGR